MSAASRRSTFKKGIDVEDARRKREDNIVELRKNKRDENLQKKRQVFSGAPNYALEDSTRVSSSGQSKVGAKISSSGRAETPAAVRHALQQPARVVIDAGPQHLEISPALSSC